MSREILINITPMETRVALVENGVPQEISIERNQKRGLVGNIYKAIVVRVLPGMQAAFLDIGEERTAFLHVDDLHHPDAESGQKADIQQLLRTGQQILVQVIKDPISSKGAEPDRNTAATRKGSHTWKHPQTWQRRAAGPKATACTAIAHGRRRRRTC